MVKKLLFISPTPTHPTDSGNRVHIKSICSFLRNSGFEVHFLFLEYETYSEDEMDRFWGSNLYIVNRASLFANYSGIRSVYKRVQSKISKSRRYIQRLMGEINENQYIYNSELDSQFPEILRRHINNLNRIHCFEIVICEYAFISKAFTFFNNRTLKVLDTHDQFTDRYQVYLQNNLKPDWVSLYSDQERKALNRADLIITLKDADRIYFEKLVRKKTISYVSFPEVKNFPSGNFQNTILYFASFNLINIQTLEYFEDKILPIVLEKNPTLRFLIGGSICKQYKPRRNCTQLFGMVENPVDFYTKGDVVINPELFGTGFKIKTLEALCYGMPIVCTTAGAQGLTNNINDHLIIADGTMNYANALIQLLQSDPLRTRLSSNAIQWSNQKKQAMGASLLMHLNNS